MNGVIIIAIVFSALAFLIIQIRFFRRFIRIKKSYDHLPGVLFLAEAIGYGCCMCLECLSESSTGASLGDSDGDAHLEKYSGKPPDEYEIKKALEDKKKGDNGYLSVESPLTEEEKSKVIDIISKRQKTGVLYVSNRTKIPEERIIEVITEDPGFVLDNEFIINKKLLEKEELKSRELKEVKEKIAEGFCPVCNISLEPDWDYCGNCGYILKQHK